MCTLLLHTVLWSCLLQVSRPRRLIFITVQVVLRIKEGGLATCAAVPPGSSKLAIWPLDSKRLTTPLLQLFCRHPHHYHRSEIVSIVPVCSLWSVLCFLETQKSWTDWLQYIVPMYCISDHFTSSHLTMHVAIPIVIFHPFHCLIYPFIQ